MLSMNVALSRQLNPAMALQLTHKLFASWSKQASNQAISPDFWEPIGPEDFFYSQPHMFDT